MVGYASVQALGLANAEIGREQAARTIGELKPAGIELRIYGAMPIDGSRPPSLRHKRPDASVAAAARGLAGPAAALHAVSLRRLWWSWSTKPARDRETNPI